MRDKPRTLIRSFDRTAWTLFGLVAVLLLAASLPASAQYRRGRSENSLRFYAGQLEPDGNSQYWNEKELDFTGDVADFEDTVVGFDYTRRLSGRWRLVAGGTFYEGETAQAYLDFVDSDGFDIVHRTRLDMDTGIVGLLLDFGPRNGPVIPYAGIGASVHVWELSEEGDFIDFTADPLEIFPASFVDDGVAIGWFYTAGLEVPLGSTWSLFAQARWYEADDELGDAFDDFGTLDLSGRELSAGFTWSF